MLAIALLGVVLLTFLLRPYRLETVEGTVSANETGCAIFTTSNGGWRDDGLVDRVAYPLEIRVFIDGCTGVSDGRPYSATLVSARSGNVVASGLSCAGTDHGAGYPCRLELPPIRTLSGQDRFHVRVVTAKGKEVRTAELQLFRKSEWRSVVIDRIMSA
jgi:hypothetical protein